MKFFKVFHISELQIEITFRSKKKVFDRASLLKKCYDHFNVRVLRHEFLQLNKNEIKFYNQLN